MGTIQKFLLDYRVSLRYYHLRMRRDNVFSRICLPVRLSVSLYMYVCVSVCLYYSNFQKPSPRKFIFGMRVHLRDI